MKPVATDLETFIQAELGSQDNGGGHIVGGPAVAIDTRATTVLAPVLQEIVSDISADAGSGSDRDLAIAWSCDEQGRCIIELSSVARARGRRSAGSAPWRASRRSSALGKTPDGMVRCEMSDRGARIIVPARYVADQHTTEDQQARVAAVSTDPLTGRSVLVVEDQLIIALDLEALLREQGAVAVQLCGSVEDAMAAIASDRPDMAILDVNLGTTTSFPVARELQRLGVPLIFATGYGNEVDFPPELRSIPLVAKPYCMRTIQEALLSTCIAHA